MPYPHWSQAIVALPAASNSTLGPNPQAASWTGTCHAAPAGLNLAVTPSTPPQTASMFSRGSTATSESSTERSARGVSSTGASQTA
jgi:hypothetical protein